MKNNTQNNSTELGRMSDAMYKPDANQVHELLWVGGDSHNNAHIAMAQFRGAEALGIKAFIDTRMEWDDEELANESGADLVYHYIPTDDHGGELKADWWVDVIAAARPHIEAGEPVLIHCHMGVNRGPSGAFAILTELLGYGFAEAYDAIREARPQAHVIYAEQWAKISGTPTEADAFVEHFKNRYDLQALIASIGKIRKAEMQGNYRVELEEVAVVIAD